MFGEETEARFVPFSNRSAPPISFLHSSLPLPLPPVLLNPTLQLPRPLRPPGAHTNVVRDAITSLPFPLAYPCSTGKRIIIFFYSNPTDRMCYLVSKRLRCSYSGRPPAILNLTEITKNKITTKLQTKLAIFYRTCFLIIRM